MSHQQNAPAASATRIAWADIAPRLPASPLTRFAPAPTGHLHLGHVVNAIHVWGLARALGGRVLLRIEDHDRQRCRPEYEASILDDLDWLGLQPDVFPTAAFRAGRACEGRQSNREAVYRQAIDALAERGLVYGCRCTRREIGAADDGTATELRYAGTCRPLGLPLVDGLSWRLVIEPVAVRFDDAIHGPTTQHPAAQCGDLLLRDRLGNWTYQFAVSVDDTAQAIDLVVRGDDLFTSTGRQILLARLLGRDTPPVFLHHRLMMRTPTQKLSKSDGDSGVRDLRAAGWTPGRVLGAAAHASGLTARADDVTVGDLASIVSNHLGPER